MEAGSVQARKSPKLTYFYLGLVYKVYRTLHLCGLNMLH